MLLVIIITIICFPGTGSCYVVMPGLKLISDPHASACKCWGTQGQPGTADISHVSEQELQAVIRSVVKKAGFSGNCMLM